MITKIKAEFDNLKTSDDFNFEKSFQRALKPSVQDSARQQQKGPLLKTFKIRTVVKKMK